MKFSAFVLTLLALAPSVALAQATAPSPAPHGMHGMHGMQGDMRARMKQDEALRLQVLHALTPANRQLLASVIGQMAVADKPDFKAAAARLDAALSSSEKSAILDAHSKMVAQRKADFAKMKAEWQSAHPDATPRPMRSPHAMRTPPTAGMMLLMLAGHHGPPMMGHGPKR
jgi:hypothetical protein